MELANDNWRVIFKYLSPNDLILLKCTNKHMHVLILQSYGNQLSSNILQIVYKNYFSLFIDYIYNDKMNLKNYSSDFSYCAGLGCSTEFTTWLKDNKLLKNSLLLRGALRSGNSNFIRYVRSLNISSCSYISIIRSMSIPVVEMVSTIFDVKDKLSFGVSLLFANHLEKKVGFQVNLTLEYIWYVIKNTPVNVISLFSHLIDYDTSLITELLNSGYKPYGCHLQSVINNSKFDLADTAIKTNSDRLIGVKFRVHSKESFEYVKRNFLLIDERKSMIAAVNMGNKQFISYLYENGVRFTTDMLDKVLGNHKNSFPKIDIIEHLISLGYVFPHDIYQYILGNSICINVDLFEYLERNGYHDATYTPNCVFGICDLPVIMAYLDCGYDVTNQTYSYIIDRGDDCFEIIKLLAERGKVLPNNICDLVATIYESKAILEYLMNLGYKITNEGVVEVARSMDVETVKFVLEKVDVTLETILTIGTLENDNDAPRETKKEVLSLLIENYVKNK